jgi:4-aminobutyrate aminotransferase-like enzyme/Ser/Thr protein kinase RdoA (MazF antagonist)
LASYETIVGTEGKRLFGKIDAVLSHARPRFRSAEAERVVLEAFGLDAVFVSELPSERDQNVLLRESSGREIVLKIASASESRAVLELQNQALDRVARRDPDLPVPRLRPARSGEAIVDVDVSEGECGSHLCRLFDYLPGRPLASVRPRRDELLRNVGRFIGRLDGALQGFSHQAQARPLKWRVENARAVLTDGIDLVEGSEKRDLLPFFLSLFETEVEARLETLPRGVIHNDANDYNLLVADDEEISGILDFGDMVDGPVVSEVATAAAYAMLEERDPLRAARLVVSGYHEERPLGEEELAVLFPLIAMRLAMSVSISARQFRDEPDKEYLRVSEAGAWRLLSWIRQQPERLGHYAFRDACDLPPHPRASAVVAFLDERASSVASVLPWKLTGERLHFFDLGVDSMELGGLDVLETTERFTRHLFERMGREGARVGVGRYDEARPIYTSEGFQPRPGDPPEPRTVHLGIDLFVEAGTEVRAPLPAKIHSFAFNDAPLDYGPTIVLEHETGDGDRFFTLYGHLSLDSLEDLERGKPVKAGELIAHVGNYPANGNWPPHLHFQIVVDLLGKQGDYPGVAAPSARSMWLGLSPDPSRILGLPAEARAPRVATERVRANRTEHLSGALSLSYHEPLHIVRGSGSFLYDAEGRAYLDMVNNVCHVGHCHPRVVRALSEQAAVLNTNTRYLHRNVVDYAARLAALLPSHLEVLFFVNSGSEANDLALRLARTHTGRKNTLVFDGAYHGNLTSLIEVSPYKFDGPGGQGAPPHVHKLDMPDPYRGMHRGSGPEVAERYLADAKRILDALAAEGRPVGALIAEAILSCGGQILPPAGYLASLFRLVRESGGVAIADEVQVGFGRVGSHFWAFESEEAAPDIVTMGKPIGNGHPLGAVATTRAIARSFQTGMEYFNTFGGNPVSCAVGLAVLDVLESEKLQENARIQGNYLLEGLRALAVHRPIVGDVRGHGLFLGFEMVTDRESLAPAAEEASRLANRMKEERILVSTDGPLHNVIKLKPPLVLSRASADRFLETLGRVLGEESFRL